MRPRPQTSAVLAVILAVIERRSSMLWNDLFCELVSCR
jgi:hypothetical protein